VSIRNTYSHLIKSTVRINSDLTSTWNCRSF